MGSKEPEVEETPQIWREEPVRLGEGEGRQHPGRLAATHRQAPERGSKKIRSSSPDPGDESSKKGSCDFQKVPLPSNRFFAQPSHLINTATLMCLESYLTFLTLHESTGQSYWICFKICPGLQGPTI